MKLKEYLKSIDVNVIGFWRILEANGIKTGLNSLYRYCREEGISYHTAKRISEFTQGKVSIDELMDKYDRKK